MGVAQDFKETFEGVQFFFNTQCVDEGGAIGLFKSNVIEITEIPLKTKEIYFEIIVSLKDNFYLPTDILIQDVYNCSERIHNISQFQNTPIKTHILFDYAYEKNN